MQKLVSIIIPVYNAEKYLDNCLKSVLGQTYKNIEIVLVNDGSTDKSLSICEEYQKKDSRIKIFSQDNKGLAGARNTGLDKMTGEEVAFLDADDYIAFNYIAYLKAMLKPEVDLSMCTLKVTDAYGCNSLIGDNYSVKTINNHDFFKESLNSSRYTSVCGKLFKKSCFKDIRFPEGKLHEDIYILAELMMNVNFINLGSESGYYYVKHAGSITTSKFSERKLDLNISNERYTNKILEYYPDLIDAANAFKIHGFSVLIKQILDEDREKYSECITKWITFARKQTVGIIFSPVVAKKEKVISIITCTNYSIIRKMWGFYDLLFR